MLLKVSTTPAHRCQYSGHLRGWPCRSASFSTSVLTRTVGLLAAELIRSRLITLGASSSAPRMIEHRLYRFSRQTMPHPERRLWHYLAGRDANFLVVAVRRTLAFSKTTTRRKFPWRDSPQ